MRRILLTLSAVAAALLGLEKVGLFELMPGRDVRFLWSAAGTHSLTMRTGVGDVTGWVALVVPRDPGDSGTWSATMGGEALAVTSAACGPALCLEIMKAPPRLTEAFTWRSGIPLVLTHAGTRARPLELHDWVVHQVEHPDDSASRASVRRVWTVASWLLLVLSLAGVALTAWKDKGEADAAPPTPAELVRRIVGVTVEGIVGKNEEDTKKVRSYLRQVLLEGVTAAEAMNAIGLPAAPTYLRLGFHGHATRLFRDRITLVYAEFNSFLAKLP